ncbi:hypothetical protein OIU85_001433 [Salix viminalis]|uniref:Uncharacterized protein n=1 Tax=Salix viminalis TaxID=40686 RepID=A0A9Q0VNQ6_SALVM|nr:hypothetical protein OIU85_001433 [Salix viminalis]
MEFATMKLFAAVLVTVMLASVAVSAQDFGEMAPAPAPVLGKGVASYSFGTSGSSYLLLSLLVSARSLEALDSCDLRCSLRSLNSVPDYEDGNFEKRPPKPQKMGSF